MRNLSRMRAALFGAALFLGAGSGCVTTEHRREPVAQANLIITRSTAGVNLTWESVRGQVYTVQMRERNQPNTKWEFHPQAINLVGTGATMTFRDNPPRGSNRQYRLHLLPVSGSRTPGR